MYVYRSTCVSDGRTDGWLVRATAPRGNLFSPKVSGHRELDSRRRVAVILNLCERFERPVDPLNRIAKAFFFISTNYINLC